MRYLNEEQEQQLNGLLGRYANEQESLTVRAGRHIIYRGTPGETPEIDRVTPQQLENLSNAVNNPSQSTGTIKISKEQSYQVQNGQQVGNNTLQPLDRSQKPSSQSPEMAKLLSQVTELKQHSVDQSNRMTAWEKEMHSMREVIERQEQLLKQANTPVHKKLGNWFDQQKEGVGNWLNQQKERIDNRIEDFRNNIESFKGNVQSSFSNAKQQVVTNIEEFKDGIKERIADAKQQTRDNIDRFTGVADLKEEVRRLREEQQQKLNQDKFNSNPLDNRPNLLLEQQLQDQRLRDQQLRDQQIRDQSLQQQQIREQQLREQQLQQQQLREQRRQEQFLAQNGIDQKKLQEKVDRIAKEYFQAPAQQQQLSKTENQQVKPPGRELDNRTKELEKWLNKAKEINRPEEYQERIKAIIKEHEQGRELSPAVERTIKLDKSLAEQNYRVIKPGDLERWQRAAAANGNKENQELAKQIRGEEDRRLVKNAILVSENEFGKYQNDLENYKKQNPQEAEHKENKLVENGQGSSRGFDSIAHFAAELQLNPGFGKNLHDGSYVRIHEELYNSKEQERALNKHLQDFPSDWQRQQELDQLRNKIGSYERVTDLMQKGLKEHNPEISLRTLKQWKQEAETLHLAGTRGKEHLERIEMIERRAEVKGRQSTYLIDVEHEKLKQDHQDFQQFARKAEQLQSQVQIESQRQPLSQTKNGAVPAQNTLEPTPVKVHTSALEQGRQEAQQSSQENFKSSDSNITTKQLELWLENAKDIGRSEEYQNRIKKVIESHNQGEPISEKAVQAMEKDAQIFLANYSEIESQYATELRQPSVTPEQAPGRTPESSQEQKPFQQVDENQATKNGQQQPKVQNGAAQSTQQVHVSELKQWRQEAEALGIHSEKYLNKIDKLTELAEQKAGSDGRVPLKEPDLKRMQADRQEFKELTKGQAETQNQTQSPAMRMR